jgi:hypothetical protein
LYRGREYVGLFYLVCGCLGIWDGIRVVGAFACDLWLGLHIECIYVEMIDVGN